MLGALTGAFSGVLCALVAATFGFVFSRGKRFDSWILIVGAVVGFIAVQLSATYFVWQEWLYTVIALALIEYGGKAVYMYGASRMKRRVNKNDVLKWTVIAGCVVFVEWWLIALFMWFLPFVFGPKFMVYEYEYDTLVFRWFATSVPQIDREAFMAYLIFGLPTFCVIVASPLTFAILNLLKKKHSIEAS